jgi:predicted outer membrane repeat protein
MKRFLSVVVSLLGLALIVTPRLSMAADCTVLNSNDTGSESLRDCIDNVATNDGDVITIDPSVTTPIGLTSGALNIDAGITINGAGPTTSIIDGSGNGGNLIFNIDSSVTDKTVNISGVTIQGATFPAAGAAIFLADNTLNLSDCIVKDNTGTSASFNGGAISTNVDAALVIDNCEFTNNQIQAGADGGAIFSEGLLSISNSTFSANFTQAGMGGQGGALYLNDGVAQIHNSTFADNASDLEGGAIYHDSGHDLIITNSSFDNNSAQDNRGGAINSNNGSLFLSDSDFTNNHAFGGASGAVQADSFAQIENCLFDGNTAADDDGGALHNDGVMILRNSTFTNNSVSEGDGGAIYVDTGAFIENCTVEGNSTSGAGSDDNGGGISVASGGTFIQNTTIFNNQAENNGGGLYVDDTTTINNLTIANNTALGDGGGIFNNSGLTFKNTIIAGNTDDGGEPDCFNNDTMTSTGPNLIQDQTGCVFTGDLSQIINDDPDLIAPPANNGGPGIGRDGANPTLTLALGDDSPALEAGDNGSCAPTDQRGTVRPQGANCDLGAFEAGASADLSTDTVVFAEQQVGTTSGAQTVTLTNNGLVALPINGISISGTNAGDFSQTNDCGGSVAPGASCNIDATFTPSDTGVRSADILVDTSANVQTVLLLGSGVAADGGGCGLHPDPNAMVHPSAFLLILLAVGGMWLLRGRS